MTMLGASSTSVSLTGGQQVLRISRHPFYSRWEEDERRQRASYLATRRHLVPFLVAHRFEGEGDVARPEKLNRSQFGYGVGLNQAFLGEILGHLRAAPVKRDFGPLTEGEVTLIEDDVTGGGDSIDNFFGHKVLEWMLTSVGGFVILDQTAPATPDAKIETKADRAREGVRPLLCWYPMSAVVDVGRSKTGFRWIKLLEERDTREPDGAAGGALTQGTVTYALQSDGATLVTRRDASDVVVGTPIPAGTFKDLDGRPMLPAVFVRYGEHPDVDWLGSGLLMGLDDIVIDLFNIMSEIREAFRDSAFGIWIYTGSDHEQVISYFKQGSRIIPLGENEKASLKRESGDPAEVDAGLRLMEQGVKNWHMSARRKSQDAAADVSSGASGVALQAEFALDLKPLLIKIAHRLDEVEELALWLIAQSMGATAVTADAVEVERETSFRLEDEAERITRIAGEFLKSLPLPGEVIARLITSWVEKSGLFDLDAEIETVGGDGTKRTLRDLIAVQADAIGDAKQQETVNAGQPGQAFVPVPLG